MCLCPVGYSGRNCENQLKIAMQPPLQPKRMSTTTTTVATNIFVAGGGGRKHFRTTTLVPSDLTSAAHHLYRIITDKTAQPPLATKSRLQSSILPPKNPCLTEKCKNNGTCVMSFSHAKNRFSFVCKCELGFFGPLCENSAAAPNITVAGFVLNEDPLRNKHFGKDSFQLKTNRRIKQGYLKFSYLEK